jgi:hypothetical protein
MTELVSSEGLSDRAIAVGRDLITLAKFDYTVMFVVIADMVFKPVATDWMILGLMVAAVLGCRASFRVAGVCASPARRLSVVRPNGIDDAAPVTRLLGLP